MAWFGTWISSVIIFFSSVLGVSQVPVSSAIVAPAYTPHKAQNSEAAQELVAPTESHKTVQASPVVQQPIKTTSEKKDVTPGARSKPSASTPPETAELPECPSKTATGCRHTEMQLYSVSNPPKGCAGTGTVSLQSPMKIEDVGVVIPMGAMVGGHVTPIDHMYLQPTVFQSAPDTYNVYADADGIIREISVEQANPENKHTKIRMTIYHTCDFYSIYNLLTSLSPRLQGIAGNLGPGQSYGEPISVEQGELLGKIGGQTLDLSVNYDKVFLKGFIVPAHYTEDWKIHTVDPFDYLKEPFRSQLLSKDIRAAEPRGGKIDFDIDGRLVGNWFVVGSEGDTGASDPGGYWKSQLAFVYDWVDPGQIRISIGNYGDLTTLQNSNELQFAVKGNVPDPKGVSVGSGLVKYELVGWGWVKADGTDWDRMSYAAGLRSVNQSGVKGTVLVQMTSERKIKFEAFPGKTAADVNSFDSDAIVYER